MSNYNASDLVRDVADQAHFTKSDARRAVDAVINLIVNAANRGETVRLNQFGTFRVVERKAKKWTNAKGETKELPVRDALVFKATKSLRNL